MGYCFRLFPHTNLLLYLATGTTLLHSTHPSFYQIAGFCQHLNCIFVAYFLGVFCAEKRLNSCSMAGAAHCFVVSTAVFRITRLPAQEPLTLPWPEADIVTLAQMPGEQRAIPGFLVVAQLAR